MMLAVKHITINKFKVRKIKFTFYIHCKNTYHKPFDYDNEMHLARILTHVLAPSKDDYLQYNEIYLAWLVDILQWAIM